MPLPPLPADTEVLYFNGERVGNRIALTFDACETEGDTEATFDTEIARILVESQTPATIFLGGLWMRDHPQETLLLAGQPLFELGNHSWSHLDFASISPEQMQEELQQTQEMMWQILGRQAHLFRFPFGTYNELALEALRQAGMIAIQWDVVSGDPDPNIDAARMTEAVVGQAQPGSIIIMHINGRGWHTAEALPGIIQGLRERGFEFVTVSELLGLGEVSDP
jgi:peptidoglycan-N-acetylglucosamine deacetylase